MNKQSLENSPEPTLYCFVLSRIDFEKQKFLGDFKDTQELCVTLDFDEVLGRLRKEVVPKNAGWLRYFRIHAYVPNKVPKNLVGSWLFNVQGTLLSSSGFIKEEVFLHPLWPLRCIGQVVAFECEVLKKYTLGIVKDIRIAQGCYPEVAEFLVQTSVYVGKTEGYSHWHIATELFPIKRDDLNTWEIWPLALEMVDLQEVLNAKKLVRHLRAPLPAPFCFDVAAEKKRIHSLLQTDEKSLFYMLLISEKAPFANGEKQTNCQVNQGPFLELEMASRAISNFIKDFKKQRELEFSCELLPNELLIGFTIQPCQWTQCAETQVTPEIDIVPEELSWKFDKVGGFLGFVDLSNSRVGKLEPFAGRVKVGDLVKMEDGSPGIVSSLRDKSTFPSQSCRNDLGFCIEDDRVDAQMFRNFQILHEPLIEHWSENELPPGKVQRLARLLIGAEIIEEIIKSFVYLD